ncbi:MAG: efflux RND transporter permease subunit, partial [Candidatus Obscuribacterales bacterium]|nr:efflux RND transporter permease subunit [Candidatus Obscuribacterales bacterium]
VDRGESIINVELPPGTPLSVTREKIGSITSILKKFPEVKSVFAQVGTATEGGGRGRTGSAGAVNSGMLYVTLVDRGERSKSQAQLEDDFREKLNSVPGPRISFMARGGITGKLKLVLIGEDSHQLREFTNQLGDEIRTIPGISDIISSAALERPEIQVIPDFAKAAKQSISVESIARTALIATLGDVDRNLPKFNLPERQINIRVQIDPSHREDPGAIKNLRVAANDGQLVPLSNVAEIRYASGEAEIKRYDRSRQVTIDASLADGLPLGEALKRIKQTPTWKKMPKTVKNIPAGDVEIQKDIFSGFAWALTVGIFLIYGVLVLLFGGFLQPLTIMMSLPLSLGGALIALMITGDTLGFYALIGIVMLMGLVTKNAILLVEYCLMTQNSGIGRTQAIIRAGETRMRPIVMTTVAMVAGMFPIALRMGAGSEARAPMAVAVIGGLITSTLLTLVVVPVVYTYIDDLENWLKEKFKFIGLNKAEPDDMKYEPPVQKSEQVKKDWPEYREPVEHQD